MPSRIHFDQWELGIDLRKDESISDANRLVDCLNAYVTTGWAIKPRPGLTEVGTLTSGTKGLMAFNGKLQTFSDSEVTHSDLSDGVSVVDNEIPNASYDIINDDFATNNGWTLGSGCTIGGTMDWDGTQPSDSESYRNAHLKNGVIYNISFDVTGRTAGSVTVYLGDQAGSTVSSNTTTTESITMDGETGRIRFVADSSFDGNIDNLTIGDTGTQIYQDSFKSNGTWSFGGTWYIDGDHLRVNGAGASGETATNNIGLVNGTAYEVSINMNSLTAGGFFIRMGTNVGPTITTSGNHTFTITMDESDGELEVVTSAANSNLQIDVITIWESLGVGSLESIPFADVFNGAIYVAAKYDNNDTKHHYLSGTKDATTGYIITDENCPHSDQNLIAASKIWSGDYDTTRYCATDDPTDWTTASDAGFLPTGTRAPGSERVVALGDFQGQLVVFASDSIQLWNIDPDPSTISIDRIIGNVGSNYPRSIQAVAGDLYFLTEVGFRSIAYQKYTENVEDVDIGTPIDDLVRPELATVTDLTSPHGIFYSGGGQYWGFLNDQIYVYTFSRTSKIAAWTRYELPVTVDYAANLGNTLYLRSGDKVYKLDTSASDDDGTDFSVEVKMAFQSFQKPGVNKKIFGFDAVVEGSADISHRHDPNNPTVETDALTVTGDTRVGMIYPVNLMTTEIAPIIRNSSGTLTRFNAISYLYDDIGGF